MEEVACKGARGGEKKNCQLREKETRKFVIREGGRHSMSSHLFAAH